MAATPCVVSVGYERRQVDEMVDDLVAHRVEKLIDVRELPLSRRREFSKSALAERLEEAGIQYLHLREAGNPYRHEKADIERCLKLYADYLAQSPQVLECVAEQISGEAVAFLCYERNHDHCHRSVLLDALAALGHPMEVVRID